MIISDYQNGGYNITLYSDGTKVREGEGLVIHPETIDIKISNYCDIGCAYCFESSTKEGQHASITDILSLLNGLPPGIELAIGGGDPLSHPELIPLLTVLKDLGFISNITVNQKTLNQPAKLELLNHLLDLNLVYGVGISVNGSDFRGIHGVNKKDNIVFHVIAGVNSTTIISKLNNLFPDCYILILGYKQYGLGATFFNKSVEKSLALWKFRIGFYLHTYNLSFDNLAIEQLEVISKLSQEDYDNYYMGDDGQFSMYVDAVESMYAKTSRSIERTSAAGTNLISFFKNLQD